MVWAKRSFFCDEYLCPQQTFTEETARFSAGHGPPARLHDALVAAVVGSGRAAIEAASSFGVSWWLVQPALDSAAVLTLPDVDAMAPRMLGIDEHRYRSVRFFRDPATKAWKRYEPWMTTLVDLDTGQLESAGALFNTLPVDLRRPVEILGLLHLFTRMGAQIDPALREAVSAVRPDGSTRRFLMPTSTMQETRNASSEGGL